MGKKTFDIGRLPGMLAIALLFAFHASVATAVNRVEKYFENTDHELTVYFNEGKEDGATMLILGGIQGDEPGGYLAADLYADIALEKGNLIVVPRTNLFSIMQNQRGVFGDLNRKFAPDTDLLDDHDMHIVETIKELMEQSDVLLNLHEGSGFYYPIHVSDMRNPDRYGQSIIVDTLSYTHESGKVIDLENPAKRVIEDINTYVMNADHLFHFNNHDTFSSTSTHKEQRGSATYNALKLFGIPAYGIETSKQIPSIDTRVKYETLAINAFMREYGIIPEHPSIELPPPKLDHLVIHTGATGHSLAVENNATLAVPAGTEITVTSVVANYKRGFWVDVAGLGKTNDMNSGVIITERTTIKVYKDAKSCGEISVVPANNAEQAGDSALTVYPPVTLDEMVFRTDGKNFVVSENDTLHIVKGDVIQILDARVGGVPTSNIRVNFYGYVGNKNYNDAEDRGYLINTGHDLMAGYGSTDDDTVYRIDTLHGSDTIGNVYVRLHEPVIDYVILENGDGIRQAVTPGSEIRCMGTHVKVLSVISNVSAEPAIGIFMDAGQRGEEQIFLPAEIDLLPDAQLSFKRKNINLGSIALKTDG